MNKRKICGVNIDLVVTVCDDATENWPVWLSKRQRVHLGFPDLAKAQGSGEEIMQVFHIIRDDIQTKIVALLNSNLSHFFGGVYGTSKS